MKKNQGFIQHNVAGSYRDPSGNMFFRDGTFYRQINRIYQRQYDHLLESGFYEELVSSGCLVSHQEVRLNHAGSTSSAVYKILKPHQIRFISYPYEWCFSQLKDAALRTLEIQATALSHGMTLKDASPYNIQFLRGKPVLIDTLSFDLYQPGQAWTAYKQFCEQFLAPLALASYRNTALIKLLSIYPEGIPLGITQTMLPWIASLNIPLFLHITAHSFSQTRFGDDVKKAKMSSISLTSLKKFVSNLHHTVQSLRLKHNKTIWSDYYQTIHYSPSVFDTKKRLIETFLTAIKPKTVVDVGANTGIFSSLAAKKGIDTIAIDSDHTVVEKLYLQCKQNSTVNILPLCIDITNPSPGIGWQNAERVSFIERMPTDMAFALAVLHHLCITHNLPFSYVSAFFRKICTWLVIEFIPKADPQFQTLLGVRGDIFPNYSQEQFEHIFRKHFTLCRIEKILDSGRLLYLMKAR